MSYWDDLDARRKERIDSGNCVVYSCESKSLKGGEYCKKHFPTKKMRTTSTNCIVTICKGRVYLDGLCKNHYIQVNGR